MSVQSPVTQTPFDCRASVAADVDRRIAPLEALLADAAAAAVPPLRRLRLLGAFGRRVDDLFQMHAGQVRVRHGDAELRTALRGLVVRAHALMRGHVLPALTGGSLPVRPVRTLGEGDRQVLSRLFLGEISPLLTPLTVDATHPFPAVASLALNLGVLVREPGARAGRYVGIEVPPALPRFVSLPHGRARVLLEDVIGTHLAGLLPGLEIVCHHAFRVTRDGRPLRARTGATGPRTRAAVRLEVEAAAPIALRRLLTRSLGLDEADVDCVEGPLDLAALARLPRASRVRPAHVEPAATAVRARS